MILQNWWYTQLMGNSLPMRPPLQKHVKADILIVGAGMAGLSAACALIDKGLKVVILEKNMFGGSSSGKSAGFLTPDSELELSQLMRQFGEKGAGDLWGAALKGIDLIVQNIKNHNIECDFEVQNSLFLGLGKSGKKAVYRELKAHEKMSFKHQFYDKENIKEVLGSTYYSSGLKCENTYVINSLLYCQAIKKILLEHGFDIFESSEVLTMNDHTATTAIGSVTADRIIFCADKLAPDIIRLSKNIHSVQTFLTISEPLDKNSIFEIFPNERLQCWDTGLIYSYFRLTGDNRILLGGGSKLSTFSLHSVNSPKVINRVIKQFKDKFPYLNDLQFIQYWPGRIDTTQDLLPIIKKDKKTPWLHFVFGCVGLPWASFCGDFAARNTINDAESSDHHFYEYFKPDRDFLVPNWLGNLLGKQLTFSMSSVWSKYFKKNKRPIRGKKKN